MTEALSYGEPSMKVGNALLTRHRVADNSIVLKNVDPDERDMLLLFAPDMFFFEDHYRGHNIVLARLSEADLARLTPFIERSWRVIAPKRVVAAYDSGGTR